MYERALDIAKGAALMTGTKYKTRLISGIYEILVNRTGAEAMQKNLETLGEITYTKDEIKYANTILKESGNLEIGLNGKVTSTSRNSASSRRIN